MNEIIVWVAIAYAVVHTWKTRAMVRRNHEIVGIAMSLVSGLIDLINNDVDKHDREINSLKKEVENTTLQFHELRDEWREMDSDELGEAVKVMVEQVLKSKKRKK